MFTFTIAWRFLTSNKFQTFLIVLGLGIGISINIFVGSLIQGLQEGLIDSTIGGQPHITISSASDDEPYFTGWQDIEETVKRIDNLKYVATGVDVRAFVMNINPDSPDVVLLRGFDLDQANGIYKFYEENFEGSKPTNANEIIVGRNFLEDLSVQLGDKLVLKGDPNPLKPMTNVTVVGSFDLGNADLNRNWVFGQANLARIIANITEKASSVNIQLKDPFDSTVVVDELEGLITTSGVKVGDWQKTNEQFLSGLQAQSQSTNIIQAAVLASVIIGVTSVLLITVLQKSRQIGILKAMGLDNRGSALVFIFEGFLLGLMGAFIGVVLGIFLALSFNQFATANLDLQVAISPDFIGISALIAVVASIAAASLPARKSSSMEVIDIIRDA